MSQFEPPERNPPLLGRHADKEVRERPGGQKGWFVGRFFIREKLNHLVNEREIRCSGQCSYGCVLCVFRSEIWVREAHVEVRKAHAAGVGVRVRVCSV